MVEVPKTGDSGEPVISDGFRSVFAISRWSLSTLTCSEWRSFSHEKLITYWSISWISPRGAGFWKGITYEKTCSEFRSLVCYWVASVYYTSNQLSTGSGGKRASHAPFPSGAFATP